MPFGLCECLQLCRSAPSAWISMRIDDDVANVLVGVWCGKVSGSLLPWFFWWCVQKQHLCVARQRRIVCLCFLFLLLAAVHPFWSPGSSQVSLNLPQKLVKTKKAFSCCAGNPGLKMPNFICGIQIMTSGLWYCGVASFAVIWNNSHYIHSVGCVWIQSCAE